MLALSLVLGLVFVSVKSFFPFVAGKIAVSRGIGYVRHHDYVPALAEFDKALKCNPNNTDTLAAAQAESGDFTAAVQSEQQASRLLKPTENRHKDDFAQRVRLYRARKPYREP